MTDTDLSARVAAVRAFSRFYTRRIGVLHEGLLGSPLSLAEGRVIWELAQREGMTAKALIARLDLDAGYLSRILRTLETQGLVERQPVTRDARQSLVVLTGAGQEAYAAINARSAAEIGEMMGRLDGAAQDELVRALVTAERLLDADRGPRAVTLRPHRIGDIGWIIHRQAAIYGDEFGWDGSFEAVLAEIGAAFIRNFDPAWEACWLAERDGAILGSVTLVRQSAEIAKLRMLYVEPAARGLGIGRLLVQTCIERARSLGYRRVTLWTNDPLIAARRIYAAAGFRLVAAESPAMAFGQLMASETWELDLAVAPANATAAAAAR